MVDKGVCHGEKKRKGQEGEKAARGDNFPGRYRTIYKNQRKISNLYIFFFNYYIYIYIIITFIILIIIITIVITKVGEVTTTSSTTVTRAEPFSTIVIFFLPLFSDSS